MSKTMQKSFSFEDIKNISKIKKRSQKKLNIQIVGNRVVIGPQKERSNIMKAHRVLVKKGMAPGAPTDPSTVAIAEILLGSVGVTFPEKNQRYTKGPDFSLLNQNRNIMDDLNPNIEDPNLKDLENYEEDTSGVFTNDADPFYELDADRSRKDKLRRRNLNKKRKAAAINSLATALAKANLNKETPSLKYFK